MRSSVWATLGVFVTSVLLGIALSNAASPPLPRPTTQPDLELENLRLRGRISELEARVELLKAELIQAQLQHAMQIDELKMHIHDWPETRAYGNQQEDMPAGSIPKTFNGNQFYLVPLGEPARPLPSTP